ncbi:MAG: hypothetical protein EGP82_09330 [Odoribacter splanchnicus]|nr:hypothetical protein [Odoribacter splanchnicus]
MEFKEKNRHIRELSNPEFLRKDRALLEQYFPGHELLSRSINSKKETLDAEILYVLLDKISPTEIQDYRIGKPQSAEVSTGISPVAPPLAPEPVKKNSQKKRSIPRSAGRKSKTKTSKKPS